MEAGNSPPVRPRGAPNHSAVAPGTPNLTPTVHLFCAYAGADRKLRTALEIHLAPLVKEGVAIWSDDMLVPGDRWDERLKEELTRADVIVLLLSADLLASQRFLEVELTIALERQRAGQARVIPVVARPCDWRATPLAALKVLPTNGRPITLWKNRDAALENVVSGIRRGLSELQQVRSETGAFSGRDGSGTVGGSRHAVRTAVLAVGGMVILWLLLGGIQAPVVPGLGADVEGLRGGAAFRWFSVIIGAGGLALIGLLVLYRDFLRVFIQARVFTTLSSTQATLLIGSAIVFTFLSTLVALFVGFVAQPAPVMFVVLVALVLLFAVAVLSIALKESNPMRVTSSPALAGPDLEASRFSWRTAGSGQRPGVAPAQKDSALFWYRKAQDAEAGGNHEVARSYLERGLKQDSRHVHSLALKIKLLLMAGGAEEREEARRLAHLHRGIDAHLDGWLDRLEAMNAYSAGIRTGDELERGYPPPPDAEEA